MPISAVIITKNAATHLPGCLRSVSFCDEILVVDSGSTDDTLRLAREAGATLIEKDWLGFGPQKKYAVDHARFDWVLCLDADEQVTDKLRTGIAAEMANPRGLVFAMRRRNRFLGRWLRHGEGYPDWSTRIFHRRSARWSDDPVHEKVVTNEQVYRIEGDLMHDSADSLDAYLAKQNRYTSLQAEQMYRDGRPGGVLHLILSPAMRFIKFFVLRMGFLDGVPGLIHVSIGCMNSFNKYAKLVAMKRLAS